MERPQPIVEASRTLDAWDSIFERQDMDLAEKAAWWRMWRYKCEGRPGTQVLAPTDVADRHGHEMIERFETLGLVDVDEKADKKSRKKDAKLWRVYVADPRESPEERVRRHTPDPQARLEFADGADHADGETATSDGSDGADTSTGGPIAGVVPIKPSHEGSDVAGSVPCDQTAASPISNRSNGCGSGPATVHPPRGQAHLAPDAPDLGPAQTLNKRSALKDSRLFSGDSSSRTESGVSKGSGASGATSARPRAGDREADVRSLAEIVGAALAGPSPDLVLRIDQWAIYIRQVVDTPDPNDPTDGPHVDAAPLPQWIVLKAAEAVADGALKPKRLHKILDRLKVVRKARFDKTGDPDKWLRSEFAFFRGALLGTFHEDGIDWKTVQLVT